MKGLVVLPAVTRACFFPSGSCSLLGQFERRRTMSVCSNLWGALCVFVLLGRARLTLLGGLDFERSPRS